MKLHKKQKFRILYRRDFQISSFSSDKSGKKQKKNKQVHKTTTTIPKDWEETKELPA